MSKGEELSGWKWEVSWVWYTDRQGQWRFVTMLNCSVVVSLQFSQTAAAIFSLWCTFNILFQEHYPRYFVVCFVCLFFVFVSMETCLMLKAWRGTPPPPSRPPSPYLPNVIDKINNGSTNASWEVLVQELCESRGGRPGISVLTSLMVSEDVKQYWTMLTHWFQLVPNMSTDIRGH